MSYLYHTFFFDPLYNFLVILFNLFPWLDAGLMVILLTLVVRLAIYPLSKKAILTQVKMSQIAPALEEIKSKYKDKPEEQAKKTLELYRENKVNPFSGILVILIQIPLIFALYQIFLHFPEVRSDLLYSFVSLPGEISTSFLGLLDDLTQRNAVIAFLAALSTYLQFKISSQFQKTPTGNSFGDNLARSMQMQMRYVFPVIVFFISYRISAVIALYWLTTNLFSVAQEVYIKKYQVKEA
jgi:YidC/Oxa1 family membrane protein insertase